jgi:hypothetical protein
MGRLPFHVACLLGALTCLALVVPTVAAEKAPGADRLRAATVRVDFARDIRPLLAARCVRCHGPKKAEGGLRLDQRTSALAGGNRGPAFEPGNSAASRLLRYVAGADPDVVMPPSGKRLTGEEVGRLRAWIEQGANWPEDAPADSRSGGQSEHWAFRPVTRPAVPAVRDRAWPRNAIDHFILARLENEGLRPAPEADRVTLIRRLSLDLLGLPPSPAEVDAFLTDTRPGAYERLVDRLLASPHYGERWGRHWLDAARYADSDGYNGDSARPIWKYRDWVIAALNRDMPFDRFTLAQLAGDLLSGATVADRIATGFHRNTVFNAEGGNDVEEFRVERVSDRVHTTGVIFLGLTLGCAECHAHKFDPISQREFYQLFAFFNTADERTLELPTPREEGKRAAIRARLDRLQSRLQGHDRSAQAADWQRQLSVWPKAPALSFASLVVGAYWCADPARQQLVNEIAKAKKQEAAAITKTLVLGEQAKPRTTRIHLRGDFRRPGAVVTPDVPAVLPPLPRNGRKPTRLDLARWLVAPANPLTARVTVNRVWLRHFGAGLVETENDFGKQGSPPTHPELLDWLAGEFMGPSPLLLSPQGRGVGVRGWSFKALHRLIVRSAAYRQSSHQRPGLAARDPHNRLLARQARFRLEAEVLRDVGLAAGGLLSTQVGGPSVFPYQPPGVMESRRSVVPWVVSPGADRYRRGMYTHFWRVSPHPFLIAFDAPKSITACTRRERSNTPLQALMLLNDPTIVDCSRGLAARVLGVADDDASRIRHAFRLCLAREPTPREYDQLHQLLDRQREEFTADPLAARQLAGVSGPAGAGVEQRAAWTAVARVLLNLDEFLTRE